MELNRPPKQKQTTNPLQAGIGSFIKASISPALLAQHTLSFEELVSSLPKRYTIYQPMLLLPPNAFTHPPAWGSLYDRLDDDLRQALYASISSAFSRFGVTHVAINAPIILTDSHGDENRMRSPVGLVPLYGNFGPPALKSGEGHQTLAQPSKEDYERAFWVRTVQNQGIVQIWAPLYTMFSRGNVTEKARILGHSSTFDGLDGASLGKEGVENVAVVDMYAGIGYFVFSYLKRGVKRIWGWEINGWSVEGLRRGCIANGWGCKVVRVQSDGKLSEPVAELVESLSETERVVIFHGDNGFAARVMGEVRAVMEKTADWTSIRHVNLGLLPSSRAAWDDACQIVDKNKGGWIHVHENVDVQQIEEMRADITKVVKASWAQYASQTGFEPRVECPHVEQVKTYAPGVMHCVFDLKLYHPNSETMQS
ncbi:S-adenosyl-L-methionine-dependent methyltransferase [Aspergillus unguis]